MSKQLKQVFESNFKFEIGQTVHHKADTHKYDNDMGVLVLERVLIESETPSGIVYGQQ